MISRIKSSWLNEAWEYVDKYEYAFDQNRRQVLDAQYVWNNSRLAWDGVLKVEYAFDEKGNYLMSASYNWNSETFTWQGTQKNVMQYNDQNDFVEHMEFEWNMITSDWQNAWKSNYIYYNPGDSSTTYRYKWNSLNSTWDSSSVTYYWHNSFNLSVSSNKINLPEKPGANADFQLTANVPWTAVSGEDWLTITPESGTTDAEITITVNPLMTKSTRSANITISGTRGLIEIITVTLDSTLIPVSTDDHGIKGKLIVFPNPFTNKICISLDQKFQSAYKIEIFDAKGVLVHKQINSPDEGYFELYPGDLKPGVYLIRVFNEHDFYRAEIIRK
jgi:hypothetical protein